jgi:hypothetical protein
MTLAFRERAKRHSAPKIAHPARRVQRTAAAETRRGRIRMLLPISKLQSLHACDLRGSAFPGTAMESLILFRQQNTVKHPIRGIARWSEAPIGRGRDGRVSIGTCFVAGLTEKALKNWVWTHDDEDPFSV